MDDFEFDAKHIWHPYSSLPATTKMFEVISTDGCNITLKNNQKLVDGMASWWSAIHGYNHPVLQQALHQQIDQFSHVMFGGLCHRPATDLARRLIEITPENLEKVFFSDSGSVAVEVAIKMALQYQVARGKSDKNKILSLEGAYHGDTLGAMSVCDPHKSMHRLFSGVLAQNIFTPRPSCEYGEAWDDSSLKALEEIIKQHHPKIAAFIIEPVVQGAGGMYFYHPNYLIRAQEICQQHDVLLIFDEIATGFGRTGKLFALEQADVSPDILCLGKALTGGMLSLAATITTEKVAKVISDAPPYAFMHGPTFMANPLACRAAIASIDLLLEGGWQSKVENIEKYLHEYLAPCKTLALVKQVRVLGAIGVVELQTEVVLAKIQVEFVKRGVWIRPFRNLIYIMPAYIMSKAEIKKLSKAIYEVIAETL